MAHRTVTLKLCSEPLQTPDLTPHPNRGVLSAAPCIWIQYTKLITLHKSRTSLARIPLYILIFQFCKPWWTLMNTSGNTSSDLNGMECGVLPVHQNYTRSSKETWRLLYSTKLRIIRYPCQLLYLGSNWFEPLPCCRLY
jgi:hypothetical protein